MARGQGTLFNISNKDKALAYAANKGIILTVEDRDIDGCDSVEGAEPTDLASELDRDYIAHHTKSRQLMRDCVTHGVIGIEGLRALLEVGTISYRQFKELETLTTQLERN